MNIFFISKDANWQKYRLEILDKLAKTNNHNIKILTTGDISQYLSDSKNIKYRTFRSIFPQKWRTSFMPGIIIYILRNKPDAILALNNVKNITEYVSLILSKIINVKFIWWTHAFDHQEKIFYTEIKRAYVLFFFHLADAIITFSPRGTEYLLNKNFSPLKVLTAPNTLDTSKIFKLRELDDVQNYHKICKNLGVNPEDRTILFSGRLLKRKRIFDGVEAFKIVEKKITNSKFVIIGGGEELEALKKIKQEGNFKNIILLGEVYDDLVLNRWFSIAKLFLIPGCLGLSIVHAFCYALPVITEKAPCHGPEIQYLKDGINGYMVEENNIQQLADRIIELLNDETKRTNFANNAFNTAKNEANIENTIKNMNLAITHSKNHQD